MNIIDYLREQFKTIEHNSIEYVEAKPLARLYKTLPQQSKSSLYNFIIDNNFTYVITRIKTDRIINMTITKEFVHCSYDLYLPIEEISNFTELVDVIEYEAKNQKKIKPKVITNIVGVETDKLDENLIVEPSQPDESLKAYKKCLTKLSGLYLVSIGTVKALRDSMNISDELYPSDEFDSARVFKYGRSKDIMHRYKDHGEQSGYGKYSDRVSLEYFVFISLNLVLAAEKDLKTYFKSNKFSFEFNDGSKNHNELVIIKSGIDQTTIQNKYLDLATKMSEVVDQPSTIQYEKQLLKAQFENQYLEYQKEILMLKLQVAELKLQLSESK